jgi:hypothetical protein
MVQFSRGKPSNIQGGKQLVFPEETICALMLCQISNIPGHGRHWEISSEKKNLVTSQKRPRACISITGLLIGHLRGRIHVRLSFSKTMQEQCYIKPAHHVKELN